MEIKVIDKSDQKPKLFHPYQIILLWVIFFGVIIVAISLDLQNSLFTLLILSSTFMLLLKKCLSYFQKTVYYIDWSKKLSISIKYKSRFKEYQRDFLRSDIKLSLVSKKSANNSLIGFSLYLIDQNKWFEFSSRLFELMELELLYEKLANEIEVYDCEGSQEALKKLKFQTQYFKNK